MPRGPSSSSRRVSVYHSRLTTNVLITGAKLNLLQRKQHEKDAAIIRATAEKESADLIREASKAGDGFVQLRKIEACKSIAETLARSRNVAYLPSSSGGGSNLLLGLNAQ